MSFSDVQRVWPFLFFDPVFKLKAFLAMGLQRAVPLGVDAFPDLDCSSVGDWDGRANEGKSSGTASRSLPLEKIPRMVAFFYQYGLHCFVSLRAAKLGPSFRLPVFLLVSWIYQQIRRHLVTESKWHLSISDLECATAPSLSRREVRDESKGY